MKICVFSDVHGNIGSLNTLFRSNDFQTSDLKIFLGDAVVGDLYPNECCKALLDNNCIWLMGNHDSYIANGLPEEEYNYFKPDEIAHQNHVRQIVKEEYKQLMKNLPKDYVVNVGNKKLYFTHYVWETWDNVIDNPKIPTFESVSDVFKAIEADYIFYGHEHKFSHYIGECKEYICVGSLGMTNPGHYTIIEVNNFEIVISHKNILY